VCRYSRRRDVENTNSRRLQELGGADKTFVCEDEGHSCALEEELGKRAPKCLHLKVGAQVILTKASPLFYLLTAVHHLAHITRIFVSFTL
jgi:hypothetical protein